MTREGGDNGDGVIGIVGLGNMGGRIARRIVGAGHEVVGYDAEPRRITDAQVRPAQSIAEVARAADVVLLSLPDSPVVEAVVLGGDGLCAHGRTGQVVIDLTTAAPRSTVNLHAALAERGIELIDAGISGGAAAAEAGTLTIMAGGQAGALERVRWALEAFSANVFHVGEVGAGHR